jgi:tetratricopeptide (TPR) repeat protein
MTDNPLRLALVLLSAAAIAACAPPPAPPRPDLVRALEARHARTPEDPEVTQALARLYYGAGRFQEALPLFEDVLARDSGNQEAGLFEGFTLDTLGRHREAVDRYRTLAGHVGSGVVRRAIAARTTILIARLRTTEVEAAVTQGSWPGAEGAAFGVLPMRYLGSDTALSGVGVGLARYVADQLFAARTSSTDTVEFDRMVELAHALRLGDAALTEPATALRLGRILDIRHVLVGTVEPVDSLTVRLRTDLVDVPSGRTVTTIVVDTSLGQLAASGARVARDAIAARDGTPQAERPDVPLRVPRVEALAAFGRGIEARLERDLSGAATAFYRALLFDATWRSARAARNETLLLLAPPRLDPRELAVRVDGPTRDAALRRHLASTAGSVAPPAAVVDLGVSPGPHGVAERKPVAEATGSMGPERAARTVIEIIIHLHLLRFP